MVWRGRGSKAMQWQCDDDLCACGTKEAEIHVCFSVNAMNR